MYTSGCVGKAERTIFAAGFEAGVKAGGEAPCHATAWLPQRRELLKVS